MDMTQAKKNKDDKSLINAGLAGASGDVVTRYGSGIKEHIVAYSGVDYENGKTLTRSLKGISQYERPDSSNPNYGSVTKSQAGFSAEVKEVARRNAEDRISGKKTITKRTDDIPGHTNHQLFDITSAVDANGNPIPGASAQMKFVGSSPREAVKRMMGKEYQKYFDNDVKMLVPSNYYDGMKADLQGRIQSLQEQIEHLKKQGKMEVLARREAELEKIKKLNKNLRKSNTSRDEAIGARNNPTLSTAKDILQVGHRAGVEQAKMGAAIGGGISLVKNVIDIYNGKKSTKAAVLSVADDTASAATLSYATAGIGSVLKGSAQNSSFAPMSSISKTNLPAYVATSIVEISKTLYAYFSNQIDGVECLEELGEKGYGMVNSALYAAIGQIVIPIPVVGALAGSMLGYALSAASYHALFDSLKNKKIARNERIRIECECAEAVAMIKRYRTDMECIIRKYLSAQQCFFNETFDRIKEALLIGDVDGYISATNAIIEKTGKRPLYSNKDEFDDLMNSSITIKI